ncbi:MAG: 6-carboxytetrahydropterin synthase [Planctomycetota bacterium]
MSLMIMRRIKFCAGHRLYEHGGKCEHFHGHNYVAEIFVTSEEVDSVGRVIDFAELKSRTKGWIDDNWDHSFLIYEQDHNAIEALEMVKPSRLFKLPYNPTAENMARYLLEEMCPTVLQDTGARAVSVRIWETEDSFAEASVD